MASSIRIFLSSTFEDLADIRARISEHLTVIPVEIVAMELFGSDESQPAEYSIEQLRGCNFFIGLYAERYGSIDPRSGLSITESEYLEAVELLKSSRLEALLLYVLDPKANWPVKFVDRDPHNVSALKELKRKMMAEHTVTFFDDPEKLSLNVLRDVLRKIGLPTPQGALKPRVPGLALAYGDPRIMGMEHYTERDAAHFHGREEAISMLAALVEQHPLSLLVGDSGIGKTSLLHAGLAPALKKRGWAIALTRPLDEPDCKITEALWEQLIDGPHNTKYSLAATLSLIAMAHADRQILVVIDQFEDAIQTLNEASTAQLRETLVRAHNVPLPNIKFLIAYRGDADPKIGPYWQATSGSPSGLPRYYLQPISPIDAIGVLSELVEGRTTEPETDHIPAELTRDLEEESRTLDMYGVYPPFLQMVAESLIKNADTSGELISNETYRQLGGAHQIIGRYLLNQLRYLGNHEPEAKRLLSELTSKSGRLRKSVEDLVLDTGLPTDQVNSVLQHLSALRLVRVQDNAWEIVHDFLARQIWEQFSNPEEQDARVFRELLIAKAAIFPSTSELLTAQELLGVYAHRKRMACSLDESKLIFVSALRWSGPHRFFSLRVDTRTSLSWARDLFESEQSDISKNAYRFALAQDDDVALHDLVEVFSDYQAQGELASLMKQCASREHLELLMKLRTKKKELVASASRDLLESMLTLSESKELSRLLRSKKYEDTALALRILPRLAQEAAATGETPVDRVLALFRGSNPKGSRKAADYFVTAHAFCLITQTRNLGEQICLTEHLLERRKLAVRRGAIAAIEAQGIGIPIQSLLTTFRQLPWETAKAVLRIVDGQHYEIIREFLSSIQITPPVRDLLIAVARSGRVDGVRCVIEMVRNADYVIEIWNVPFLADNLARYSDRSLLDYLRPFLQSAEFWKHIGRDDAEQDRLAVKNRDNVYLFKRIVGVCLAHICSEEDWDLLRRLTSHPYSIVANQAARRIATFANVEHLDMLISDFRQRGQADIDLFAVNIVDASVYQRRWRENHVRLFGFGGSAAPPVNHKGDDRKATPHGLLQLAVYVGVAAASVRNCTVACCTQCSPGRVLDLLLHLTTRLLNKSRNN